MNVVENKPKVTPAHNLTPFTHPTAKSPSVGRAVETVAHNLVFNETPPRPEAATKTPLPPTVWTQHLMPDANSSQLTNFPFAFTAFATLMIGFVMAIIGSVIISLWWSGLGLLLTLIGGTMYGCSLCGK